MKNNNKSLIASLIAGLFIAPAHADEPTCDDARFCTLQAQPGKSLSRSQVLIRENGKTAANLEYRQPDEVIVLADEAPADTVVTEERRTRETTAQQEQGQAIGYDSGDNALSQRERDALTTLAQRLAGKPNLRLAIVGHADEQRLSARKRATYGNNLGLSEARAREAAAFLHTLSGFGSVPIATSGKGDAEPVVQCEKKSPVADYQACLAPNRRVEIQVWYDQVTERVEQVTHVVEAPKPAPVECSQAQGSPSALPFRISVDGEPLVDADRPNSADVTRCVDVALERADIQVRYDAMEATPWLNVSVFPNAAVRHQPVTFTAYTNYQYWIAGAEVRVFGLNESLQGTPMAVIPLDERGQAHWTPAQADLKQVRYVLRVYDRDGKFDETAPQPLTIAEKPDLLARDTQQREELIGYGENRLSVHNIAVSGGAVTVNGEHLQPGQRVRFLGQEIPVDAHGKFAARQILPAGSHVVDVDVLDETTTALHFARNLYIPDRDWFYIALGDLTAGRNSTSGPARLVTGDTQHFDNQAYVDGRMAFYLKGKIKGDWLLTASADTKEQPLKNLFSNFDEKDPRYLLRRLDPDRYYPVYGDDSTTVDDAPTRGKFYVKLAKGDSHAMWGNFQTQLSGSDLVQYSRGLYGANLKWRSDDVTAFGQKKTQVDFFAGDPGTLGAREQFRGTGGSLYYVQHQDVTRGSEHLWVEVRDKDSGIVLKVTQLSATQDYDFDPIQGRILLRTPLPSTADDSQLVRAGSLSGHPVYLVSTYEYAPGVSQPGNMTYGGRAAQWLGENVQIGVTGYRQGDAATRQNLIGVDATYRVAPGVYLKAETARSSGPGTSTQSSVTGGFEFNAIQSPGGVANAHRVEAAVNLAEISDQKGKLNAYWQDRERGYSSPGQITSEDIRQSGFGGEIEIAKDTTLQAKADIKDATSQDTKAVTASVKHQFTPNWAGSVGVRHDDLDTRIANASPTLSQNGERTDLGVQVDYNPAPETEKPDWKAYGFFQDTVRSSGNRRDNNRLGVGGSWQLNEKFNLLGELSSGNGGVGGKVGGDWQVTDRSQLYMNYALDTDRTDSLYRGRQGTLVSGSKTRFTDNLSVYGEDRLMHGVGPSGLLHAFGLDLAARDGWNFGVKGETGDLSDPLAGDFSRKALSFSVGRSVEKIKYAGNVEWRKEDGTQVGERTTWLVRNAFGYQIDPDWRFLGKLNFSVSDSNRGSSLNSDFTEAVAGYAWRPVNNDKVNALFKYTYYANQPSPAAISTAGVAADYEQRSHILSIDAIYDVKPWLSVGGKYGFRRAEMRAPKTSGDWENADAHLLIGRADWHFVHNWDAMLELRWLNVTAADDSRAGALAGVYRHINENVKAGVGYNFTDFSDDMTDMSYRSHGWFVNLISKF